MLKPDPWLTRQLLTRPRVFWCSGYLPGPKVHPSTDLTHVIFSLYLLHTTCKCILKKRNWWTTSFYHQLLNCCRMLVPVVTSLKLISRAVCCWPQLSASWRTFLLPAKSDWSCTWWRNLLHNAGTSWRCHMVLQLATMGWTYSESLKVSTWQLCLGGVVLMTSTPPQCSTKPLLFYLQCLCSSVWRRFGSLVIRGKAQTCVSGYDCSDVQTDCVWQLEINQSVSRLLTSDKEICSFNS